MSTKPKPKKLFHPRYWLTYIAIGFIWLIGKMPSVIQRGIARILGWLFYLFASRRRQIADTNLRLCFPDLSSAKRKKLLKGSFIALAQGLIETAACWNTDLQTQLKKTTIKGQEHLQKALEDGKGVLLLSFHLTSLEIGGCLLSHHFPLWPMYKPDSNPVFENAMRQGRLRHTEGLLLDRDNIRATIRSLKNNKIVWYATDQNYGSKTGVFAPFFGIQAATITATTRFAKLTGAPVIPFTQKRLANGHYELTIHPPMQNIPSDNAETDATQINLFLENYLKRNPVDYMWVHRRFRNRPAGEPLIYPEKNRFYTTLRPAQFNKLFNECTDIFQELDWSLHQQQNTLIIRQWHQHAFTKNMLLPKTWPYAKKVKRLRDLQLPIANVVRVSYCPNEQCHIAKIAHPHSVHTYHEQQVPTARQVAEIAKTLACLHQAGYQQNKIRLQQFYATQYATHFIASPHASFSTSLAQTKIIHDVSNLCCSLKKASYHDKQLFEADTDLSAVEYFCHHYSKNAKHNEQQANNLLAGVNNALIKNQCDYECK